MAANDDVKKSADSADAAAKASDALQIDTNLMRITILILCREEKKFENAANYLSRRGWNAVVTSEIIGAFKQIGTLKPDFIMLSVNLPTSKVGKIPSLIKSTFNVPVITFGESQDLKTQKLLEDVRGDYLLQGPVSGPGTQRRIKSILKEMYEKGDEVGEKIIKRQIERIKAEQERAAQAQKNAAPYGENENMIASASAGSRRRNLGALAFSHEDDALEREQAAEDEFNSLFNEVDVSSSDEMEKLQKDASAELSEKSQETGKRDALNEIVEDRKKEAGGDFGTVTTRTAAGGYGRAKEHLFQVQAKASPNSIIGQAKADILASMGHAKTPEEALLEGVIVHSANAAITPAQHPVQGLIEADRCSLWPIQYGKFSGVVLVAHGGSLIEEDRFMSLFVDYLRNQGRRQRQKLEIGDVLSTNLDKVNLNERIEGEIFSKQIQSGHHEIILKLIEVRPQRLSLVADKFRDKVRVAGEDLFPDLPPGADLYIHMPVNERFFLYLKEKSVLSLKQYEKLVVAKTSLYLNSGDIEKFKKTHSHHSLVQKIREMGRARKKPA